MAAIDLVIRPYLSTSQCFLAAAPVYCCSIKSACLLCSLVSHSTGRGGGGAEISYEKKGCASLDRNDKYSNFSNLLTTKLKMLNCSSVISFLSNLKWRGNWPWGVHCTKHFLFCIYPVRFLFFPPPITGLLYDQPSFFFLVSCSPPPPLPSPLSFNSFSPDLSGSPPPPPYTFTNTRQYISRQYKLRNTDKRSLSLTFTLSFSDSDSVSFQIQLLKSHSRI